MHGLRYQEKTAHRLLQHLVLHVQTTVLRWVRYGWWINRDQREKKSDKNADAYLVACNTRW